MEEYYDDEDTYQAGKIEGREEGMECGLAQGLEQGISIGIEKNQIEMATEMLKRGIDPKIVQECSKLSSNRIKSIMTLL